MKTKLIIIPSQILALGLLALGALGAADDGGCGVSPGGELCTSTSGEWSEDWHMSSPTCGVISHRIDAHVATCRCPQDAPYWTDGIGCNNKCEAGRCVGTANPCDSFGSQDCFGQVGCTGDIYSAIATDIVKCFDKPDRGAEGDCRYFGTEDACNKQRGCHWEK